MCSELLKISRYNLLAVRDSITGRVCVWVGGESVRVRAAGLEHEPKRRELSIRRETIETMRTASRSPMVIVLLYCSWFLAESFQGVPSAGLRSLPSVGRLLALHTNEDSTLGAPRTRPVDGSYVSESGVEVQFEISDVDDSAAEINKMITQLDDQKGVLLTSSYEFPGRYARWSVGFTAPALQIEGRGLDFSITALNERGHVLCDILQARLAKDASFILANEGDHGGLLKGSVVPAKVNEYFSEEERSKQPSLFSLIRAVREVFSSPTAGQLGLYGALGYDLTFQFEPIALKKERDADQRDLVMFFPDEILIVDNQKNDAWKVKYEFSTDKLSTKGLQRTPSESKYVAAPLDARFEARDSAAGKFAESVVRAKEEFRVGNLFEVVLSQAFRARLTAKPSEIFKRLCRRNPAPYGFFMNLGSDEYLVGASPEMFVRVETTRKGLRVETCPISGTIERGSDPLEDAQQIKKLLLNPKEESELTMCTDVDRNDKSRICQPGTVRVLGRRQIEMYSRLIHTVDHVEGYLRAGFDALDAFLCHTWAVTVTGAPKTWAIRFIEDIEPGARHWYGGAVGMVGFDGTLNTGLTLRTIRVKKGIAEVRAGATLLHDRLVFFSLPLRLTSIPQAKKSNFLK